MNAGHVGTVAQTAKKSLRDYFVLIGVAAVFGDFDEMRIGGRCGGGLGRHRGVLTFQRRAAGTYQQRPAAAGIDQYEPFMFSTPKKPFPSSLCRPVE